MDLRKIKKLMELVEESGISELEVRSGDESVRIVRPLGVAADAPAERAPGPAGAGSEQPAASGARSAAGEPLRAPMAGTFYAAPEPGAEPFVRPGQAVAAGEVLCIIESMKMMNEIRAEHAGTCTAVEVQNGQAVNAGDVLIRLG